MLRKLTPKSTAMTFAALLLVFTASTFGAVKQQVLHSFTGTPDGSAPVAPLVADKNGNLYGTTWFGGANSMGCLFELSPTQSGWQETVLHSFTGGGDGAYPIAGLIVDQNGNLYGTALEGGSVGVGDVFELAPSQSGWTFTVLYNFHGDDGADPSYGKLVLDKNGALYGATQLGGSSGVGTIFKLTPSQSGWKERVLYSFTDAEVYPYGVVMDGHGNLFGTTPGGGNNLGNVFELAPQQNGEWTFSVLFTFQGGEQGAYLSSGVILDNDGNLYGTTSQGGSSGLGLIFQLVPQNGTWTENVLHVFDYGDGFSPDSLVFDPKGNLFGETENGNMGGYCAYPGCGVLFELSPSGSNWDYSLIFNFDGSDGSGPEGGLLLRSDSLFGTTVAGGSANAGVVFEVAP